MRPPTTPKRRSDHTFQVSFYISRTLLDLVELFADNHGMSCSGAVNRLIIMGLENTRAEGSAHQSDSPGLPRHEDPGDATKISITIADHMLELLDYSACRNDLNRSAEIRRLLDIALHGGPAEPAGEITGHLL